MPAIDREKFAYRLAWALNQKGIEGPRAAERRWPKIRAPMWSRALRGDVRGPDNFVAICFVAGLDPFEFLDMEARNPKHIRSTAEIRRERMAGAAA